MQVVIGIDPHKASLTAVAIDEADRSRTAESALPSRPLAPG